MEDLGVGAEFVSMPEKVSDRVPTVTLWALCTDNNCLVGAPPLLGFSMRTRDPPPFLAPRTPPFPLLSKKIKNVRNVHRACDPYAT